MPSQQTCIVIWYDYLVTLHDYNFNRPGLVKQTVVAIWCSHRGLAESEMLDILQVTIMCYKYIISKVNT